MMRIKVLFFGMTHDLTGFAQEDAQIAEGASLEQLWQYYERRFPRLSEIAGSLVMAVNEQITEPSSPLRDGDEVAFMPPVSGGSSNDFYLITREAIPTYELACRLKSPHDGGVVIFEGIVRDHSHGRKTLYLEYEAYEPMAIRKMEETGREVKQKFGVEGIGMIHRVGRLEIGETSVAIVVSAPHRHAAFNACRYAIDRLKQVVPIWKKEYFEDGAVWAESEGQTRVLVEARPLGD